MNVDQVGQDISAFKTFTTLKNYTSVTLSNRLQTIQFSDICGIINHFFFYVLSVWRQHLL